jgi:hypothetical protein
MPPQVFAAIARRWHVLAHRKGEGQNVQRHQSSSREAERKNKEENKPCHILL